MLSTLTIAVFFIVIRITVSVSSFVLFACLVQTFLLPCHPFSHFIFFETSPVYIWTTCLLYWVVVLHSYTACFSMQCFLFLFLFIIFFSILLFTLPLSFCVFHYHFCHFFSTSRITFILTFVLADSPFTGIFSSSALTVFPSNHSYSCV